MDGCGEEVGFPVGADVVAVLEQSHRKFEVMDLRSGFDAHQVQCGFHVGIAVRVLLSPAEGHFHGSVDVLESGAGH